MLLNLICKCYFITIPNSTGKYYTGLFRHWIPRESTTVIPRESTTRILLKEAKSYLKSTVIGMVDTPSLRLIDLQASVRLSKSKGF